MHFSHLETEWGGINIVLKVTGRHTSDTYLRAIETSYFAGSDKVTMLLFVLNSFAKAGLVVFCMCDATNHETC